MNIDSKIKNMGGDNDLSMNNDKEEKVEELPREELEKVIDNSPEEKEDAVQNLEEEILNKLEKSGALKNEEEGVGEANFFNLFFRTKTEAEIKYDLDTELKEVRKRQEELVKKGVPQTDKEFKKLKEREFDIRLKRVYYETYLIKARRWRWRANTAYISFTKAKNRFSTAISLWTHSEFSHTDLILDGKCYTSTTSHGVNIYNMDPEGEVIIYELSPKISYKKIKEFMKKTKGKTYGYTTAMRALVLKWKQENKDPDEYFCSQWVSAALDYASGFKLMYKGEKMVDYGYDNISPGDLLKYLLEEHWIVKKFHEDNQKRMNTLEEMEAYAYGKKGLPF